MAEIKIRGDVSGSTTIKAPDSGLDEVIELSSALASKLPYAFGTATPNTSVDGFLWYDENSTPPTPKFWDGAAFQALTSGKILQIVRATDTTNRTTTSTSFVDVTGMSVSITPQKSDSAVLIIASFEGSVSLSNLAAYFQIADSSNNAISGAEASRLYTASGGNTFIPMTVIAYATPATTSTVTYKLRFKVDSGQTAQISNSSGSTGQIYAIEVSA